MDDSQAILAELEAAWYERATDADTPLASRVANGSSDVRNFVYGYLSHKRRYQKAPEPVKTRMTADEWWDSLPGADDPEQRYSAIMGWNAALANVQPGGRFEIGQPVYFSTPDRPVERMGSIAVAYGASYFLPDPADVRPAPKTVDLTDDEKLTALVNKVFDSVSKNRMLPHETLLADTWATIARATTTGGKTLDELCAQYGVAITKEVS